MVLFLFIIMLLDLQAEERRKLNVAGGMRAAVSWPSSSSRSSGWSCKRFAARASSRFPPLASGEPTDR